MTYAVHLSYTNPAQVCTSAHSQSQAASHSIVSHEP